jgi:hypothetical protein
MAEWFVRPTRKYDSYGNGSGTSYENAFTGFWQVVTFTADPDTDIVTFSGSKEFGHPIYVWSTGTLPAPLSPNVQYFLAWSAGGNTKIATNKETTNIVNITDTGTGTHYMSFGINWNAVNAGDTLYFLDDWLSMTGFNNTNSVMKVTRPYIFKNGVTIKGKYPGKPDGVIIFGDRLCVWRETGVNGVLWTDVLSANQFLISKGTDGTIFSSDEVREYYPNPLVESVPSGSVYPATDEIAVVGAWNVGDRLQVRTNGTLPGGLSTTTIYFIRTLSGGRCQLSLTPGGSVVDITSTGSGTHTLIRMFDDATLNDFNADRFYSNNYHAYYKPGKPVVTSMTYNGMLTDPVLMHLENQSNITFEDLLFYGMIRIKNCENITFDRVTIKNGRRGIDFIDNNQGMAVRNCVFENCGDGIYSSGTATLITDSIIENNIFININPNGIGYFSGDCHAIGIQGARNLIVRNNYVKTASTGVTWYVDNIPSNPGVQQSIIIYNNYISDIYSFGTGFADRRSSGTTLVCPWVDFVAKYGVGIGTKVKNRTTGATGTVTGITTTINTNDTLLIDSLSGGSRNNWQRRDVWQVSTYKQEGTRHGAAIDFHGPIEGHTIDYQCYNNIVYNVDGPAFRFNSGGLIEWNGVVRIYNNTAINCVIGAQALASTGGSHNALFFRNNIMVFRHNGMAFPITIWHVAGPAPTANTDINNNLYYVPTDPNLTGDYFMWRNAIGNYLVGLSQHRAVMQTNNPDNETNLLITDPLVIDDFGDAPESYKLQENSPCRRAGKTAVYDLVTADYFGNTRYNETGGFCIGAHEKWNNITISIGS